MNHYAEWMKAELTRLMNEAAEKMENGGTPEEKDKAGAERQAYQKVLSMVDQMERQAFSIGAAIRENGLTVSAVEAQSVKIQITKAGQAMAYFADRRGETMAWEALEAGQDMIITTNKILGRYELEGRSK